MSKASGNEQCRATVWKKDKAGGEEVEARCQRSSTGNSPYCYIHENKAPVDYVDTERTNNDGD